MQYRSVLSVAPANCAGTPGALTMQCVYSPPADTSNHTAMWWSTQEPGWGLNVNHQDSTLFATLFSYTSSGAPMWLMASGMKRQSDGSYGGDLFRVTGPVFNKTPWTKVTPTQVGQMTLQFAGENAATLMYNVGGTNITKRLARFSFGTPAVCASMSGSRAAATNYQDFWWNAQEAGWGLNILHEGAVLFATLFSYDSSGTDMWLVASRLDKQADGSFSGPLSRMTGPWFASSPWGTATPRETGVMTLRFTNGDTGTLSYTVDSTAVTKSIQRHVLHD